VIRGSGHERGLGQRVEVVVGDERERNRAVDELIRNAVVEVVHIDRGELAGRVIAVGLLVRVRPMGRRRAAEIAICHHVLTIASALRLVGHIVLGTRVEGVREAVEPAKRDGEAGTRSERGAEALAGGGELLVRRGAVHEGVATERTVGVVGCLVAGT
jgi:hypothetical protein